MSSGRYESSPHPHLGFPPSCRSNLCQMKPGSPLWQIWKVTADSNPTVMWLSFCPSWGWLQHSCSEICTIQCVPLSSALALHVCVCVHPHISAVSPRFVFVHVLCTWKPSSCITERFSETKMGTFWVFSYSNSIGIFDVAISLTIRNRRERMVLFLYGNR